MAVCFLLFSSFGVKGVHENFVLRVSAFKKPSSARTYWQRRVIVVLG
jgi:hypothetical protein